MIIPVDLGEKSYPIIIERGALKRLGTQVGSDRRVCLVSDSGVPAAYVASAKESLSARGCEVTSFTFPQGESSKTFEPYLALQKTMLDAHFTRRDAVVALGGGVVGDLAGFAAATYMRGVDFYNVPTTVLSQVDSSVGGKTAVDFEGYKNMIGAFHQPRTVLIDPELLLTLPVRQVANGLCEALKMGLTLDAALFALFEGEPLLPPAAPDTPLGEVADETTLSRLGEVIARAVKVKRDVVQADEQESDLRRVLNFGHTLGHAVESCVGLGELYHGECVAIGIPPMCGENIRDRVTAALHKLGLPTAPPPSVSPDALTAAIAHDKKAGQGMVTVVLCNEIGAFTFAHETPENITRRLIY